MTVQQETAEVFLTAFKALPRREQDDILGRIARDRRLRRVLEEISDRVAIAFVWGDHRVVCQVDDRAHTVEIVRIAHRRAVYR